MPKSTLDKLLPIARIPDENRGEWLERADHSGEILKDILKTDEIVIYASGPHMLIHSVLPPDELLDPPDHADLDRAYIMPDDSWIIQRAYDGGEGHRVYLQPPLDHPGCKSRVGGEKLVFVRSFEGVKDYEPTIEISQKLVHALGLHFKDERNAYCRLNDRGDNEPIISVYLDEIHGGNPPIFRGAYQ